MSIEDPNADPPGRRRYGGWWVVASSACFVSLLVWRYVFAGLGCFDAEPGQCSPPPDAFRTIDRLLLLSGAALTVAVAFWIERRFVRR